MSPTHTLHICHCIRHNMSHTQPSAIHAQPTHSAGEWDRRNPSEFEDPWRVRKWNMNNWLTSSMSFITTTTHLPFGTTNLTRKVLCGKLYIIFGYISKWGTRERNRKWHSLSLGRTPAMPHSHAVSLWILLDVSYSIYCAWLKFIHNNFHHHAACWWHAMEKRVKARDTTGEALGTGGSVVISRSLGGTGAKIVHSLFATFSSLTISQLVSQSQPIEGEM